MAAHASIDKALAEWFGLHQWPQDTPQSVVVVAAANRDGTVFNFHSTFDTFQVTAAYSEATGTLSDVQIHLHVPTRGETAILAAANSYPISTSPGAPIQFDLDNGYVSGSVSFKLTDQGGKKNIFATYSAQLPFAGTVEGTVNVAPTQASEAAGLHPEHVKAIRPLTPSEEKALASPSPGNVVIRALNDQESEQQTLLVKYLRDFVTTEHGPSVAVVTYYEGLSKTYTFSFSFLKVLVLEGSIDTSTLTISATLYLHFLGKHKLTGISGSLLGGGVKATLNLYLVTGKATFTAKKNESGKHVIYVDASLKIRFDGSISTHGPVPIFTLPF